MNKIKEIFKKYKKTIITIVLIFIPILLELITTEQLVYNKDFIIRMVIRYGLEFLVVFYFICCKYQKIVKKVLDFIIQKRFIIIAIVFILGVVFKIHLASTNIWANFINEDGGAKNIIGVSRGIRSDEWLVQSTYFLAQTKNEDGYTERNDHIMQGNFNVLMNSGPVLDLCTISKPLIWGFLLFGTDYGFSWWWMLRIILLLLVSFEAMKIITKKDNLLSITGMFVLALAPRINVVD